jgi:hypothetical protein
MVESQRIEPAERQTTRLSRTDYRLNLNRQHAHGRWHHVRGKADRDRSQ